MCFSFGQIIIIKNLAGSGRKVTKFKKWYASHKFLHNVRYKYLLKPKKKSWFTKAYQVNVFQFQFWRPIDT